MLDTVTPSLWLRQSVCGKSQHHWALAGMRGREWLRSTDFPLWERVTTHARGTRIPRRVHLRALSTAPAHERRDP